MQTQQPPISQAITKSVDAAKANAGSGLDDQPLPQKGHHVPSTTGNRVTVQPLPPPTPTACNRQAYMGSSYTAPQAMQLAQGPQLQAGHIPHQDWVADFVREMWPYITGAFERVAWETVPDVLEASRPSWVHGITMKKFVLGSAPPAVSNIRVHSTSSPIGSEVFLEFDFDWRSQQDIQIEIVVPRLPLLLSELLPNSIEDQLRLWLKLTVKVSNLVLRGSARATLRPVWDRLPLVGGLQLALVRPPEYHYDLSLGPVLASLLPLVKTWMDGAVKEMVLQPYTLPEHYFMQLDPQAQDLDTPTGVLVVKAVAADGVPKMDLLSQSDPYLELYVRDLQRQQTTVRPKTRHPRWDQAFYLPVHVPEHQKLTVILWDSDDWTPDDEIGRAEVPLTTLQPGTVHNLRLEIKSREEQRYREEKVKQGGWTRVAMALGRPFTKQSSKPCQLHLQVKYHTLSQAEVHTVAFSRRYGRSAALDSPEAVQVSPEVRHALMSGFLTVRGARVEDLPMASGIRSPHVKAQLRVGEAHRESSGVKVSSRGSVEIPTPLVLHLGPHHLQDPHAQVELELLQDGWLGAKARGRVAFRLQEVVAAQKLEGQYRLRYGAGGSIKLVVEWAPYF